MQPDAEGARAAFRRSGCGSIPDCGLKTRQWAEVIPALTNMVAAAKALRSQAH